MQAVCEKYAELVEDQKEAQSAVKTYERHLQVLQREKEHLQTENSKGILARSRLEELCRELQRQNKVIKGKRLVIWNYSNTFFFVILFTLRDNVINFIISF